MNNIRESLKNKIKENTPALVAVAGMSTLLSAVYFAGKSKGKNTFILVLDDNGVINLENVQ